MLTVNCAFNAWGNWDTCTKTCGGGTHQRARSIGVVVAHGGTNCTGSAIENGVCNAHSCPGSEYIMLLCAN